MEQPGRQPGRIPSVQQQQIQQVQEDIRDKLQRETGKLVLDWEPRHNSDIAIELESCVIYGVPEYIMSESDPHSRMILALVGEVMYLRGKMEEMESAAQSGSLKTQALAAKDAAVAHAMAENAKKEMAENG